MKLWPALRFCAVLLICPSLAVAESAEASAPLNFAPRISPARGSPVVRPPRAYAVKDGFVLENRSLAAEFSTDGGLRLRSLRNEYEGRNVLVDPAQTRLFLLEIGGRRFGAENWRVGAVTLAAEGAAVDLTLPSQGLSARLALAVDRDELKLGLRVDNRSAETRDWKVAFPQLGGVSLSPRPADDYYLYPLHGGVIHRVPVNLRATYGDGSAWWQMVDVFSPGEGTGLALRSLDAGAYFKGIAFRKGPPGAGAPVVSSSAGPKAEDVWKNSLPGGVGSALAFEYARLVRVSGEGFTYPEAAVRMHRGDWHEPMRAYADWAHRVWSWRPSANKLRDTWQISVLTIRRPGQFAKTLFDGKWYDRFDRDGFDGAEFIAWWKWSDRGPFGIDLDRAKEECGDKFYERYKSDLTQVNPATGQRQYPYNRGDYDYSPSWGGLEALRREIASAHRAGQIVQFYTDPILVDDNSLMARQFARKYGVVSSIPPAAPIHGRGVPHDGHLIQYGQWQMDPDAPGWRKLVAAQVARIVRDTGVDAVRLDQVGAGRPVCLSREHEHTFAEEGHSAWMQAYRALAEEIHSAVKEIKPDFILTCEHVGNDFLCSALEGGLVYETRSFLHPVLRPIPLTIFRFYFPEYKLFDYPAIDANEKTRFSRRPELPFWNALGRFREPYPETLHAVLQQNGDAFASRDSEPLVPTLVERVYANRFAVGGKEVVLFYNDSGAAVDGPVWPAETGAGCHYFDLLHGRERRAQEDGVRLAVPSQGVAALARLPRVLRLVPLEQGWRLERSDPVAAGDTLAFCRSDGTVLARRSAAASELRFDRAEAGAAVCVKLLRGGYLVDAVELPR